MGKLQKFDIIFDNPSGVYLAGQVITGRVIIILSAPMEMKGVGIKFIGRSNVHWSEHRTRSHNHHHRNHRHSNTVHYSASECYFDHLLILRGQGRKETLPAGEHFLPFAFTLPLVIPSSFEGTHGYVRYFCKANIDRPWKFDSVCKMPFTVNSLLDLNQQMTSRQSATNEAHKSICCCCCKSGPISVVATINRMGYVPGESVLINAEVENLTRRAMNCTKAALRAIITYRAQGKSRVEVKDIAEVKRGIIEPRQSEVWSAVPIPIPPIPPSNLVGCNIIDIQYRLDFIVDPSGPAFDLVVSLPLLIGTIPLQNYFASFQSPPTYSQVATYDPSAPPMPQQYPNAPPPSYAESVFGQVDIRDHDDNEHTHGKFNYTPVYTYYNVTPGAPLNYQ